MPPKRKKVAALVKIALNAGAATPAPPVGTALGPHGVNIMEFCKAYNAATESMRGTIIPVEITIYEDRTFSFITKTPPAAELIKKAAGVPKGSGVPHREKVGKISRDQLRDIATTKLPDLKPVSKAPKTHTKGEKALAFAKKQLGDPYVRNAAGPNGWDCSGLSMKAWKAAGVSLPHSAGKQYRIGQKISKSNLRNGDLVFFYPGIKHVALYAGNGNVIHAPHPGKKVQYIKMKYMPYMGARRPA